MLTEATRRLWHTAAASGTPPPPADYARHGLGLLTPWHVRDHFLSPLSCIDASGSRKHRFAREVSRDHSKTTSLYLAVLYTAEFIIPYLPVSPINKRILLIGRDKPHVNQSLMRGLESFIAAHAPWLKLADWEGKSVPEVESAMLKARTWNRDQFDLTNGVSIRGRSINQSIRGEHVYFIAIDDLVDEKNWNQAEQQHQLIQSALMPALNDGGIFLCTGTPQTDGDLYDRLASDPQWDYVRLPAEHPDDADASAHYEARNRSDLEDGYLPERPGRPYAKGDLQCLWPWRHDAESLAEARGHTRHSQLLYEREYLLRRVTLSGALIPHEDLLAAKDPTTHYVHAAQPGEAYFGGADPSSLRRSDAAICIGVIDEDGARLPRYLEKIPASSSEHNGEIRVLEAFNEATERFPNIILNVEANQYQGIIIPLLSQKNPASHIRPYTLGSQKHHEAGWLGLRTLFRSRKIRLPYGPTPNEAAQIKAGLLDPDDIEAKRITDELILQLRRIAYIDGKVVSDDKDDLVSALFLFTKACEGHDSTAQPLTVAPSSSFAAASSSALGSGPRRGELPDKRPARTPADRVAAATRLHQRRLRRL